MTRYSASIVDAFANCGHPLLVQQESVADSRWYVYVRMLILCICIINCPRPNLHHGLLRAVENELALQLSVSSYTAENQTSLEEIR